MLLGTVLAVLMVVLATGALYGGALGACGLAGGSLSAAWLGARKGRR